jgi:hypothetical protein
MWQKFRSWPQWAQILAWLFASPIVWSAWVLQKLWPIWARVGLVLATWGVVALVAASGSASNESSAAMPEARTTPEPAITDVSTTTSAETTTEGESSAEPETTTESESPVPTTTTTSSGDPDVDKHTRYYMNQMSTCMVGVGLVILDIQDQKDDFTLADDATNARDLCDDVRTNLALADTDHFDDQAALGFYAVDRYKSGLNALLEFIDTQETTKLVEVQNKLQDADASATEAFKAINQRRRLYGLQPYRP